MTSDPSSPDCVEEIQVEGHVIDSLILPKVLDIITLHSIAVGNLLPAWVDVACVNINPSTVIKLADRGSAQTAGIVTDVEPFLRALVGEIDALEANA